MLPTYITSAPEPKVKFFSDTLQVCSSTGSMMISAVCGSVLSPSMETTRLSV